MLRKLTVVILFSFLAMLTFAQRDNGFPRFKSGKLSSSSSLLGLKINHSYWTKTRFGNDYFIVLQLNKVANENLKTDLANQGFQLKQFVSGTTYLATFHGDLVPKNVSALGIRNLFFIPSALKKGTITGNPAGRTDPKELIVVGCYPIEKYVAAAAIIETGAQIVDTKIKPANTWFVYASSETIEKLAELPFVANISRRRLEDVLLNYNNHAAHDVYALSSSLGRNLSGKNLVLGIGDNADPSGHADFSNRLIMRTDEPVTDHGIHTSGSFAGAGIINPMYAGMAPRAKLVVNDFSNIIVNAPTYITDYSMPLTNNSYYNGLANCPGDGDYDALASYIDDQLTQYPKILHVFAAGNDGSLTCSPLPPHFGTIKSGFQAGKNVLSIGSIFNTNYSISPNSSRGPLADGRIKPDIVAGGVGIMSTISGNNYGFMNGTSMASPTAAGILALLIERYRQLHGNSYPDGALIKTIVMNSADDLGNPGPDFTFGFGKINARTSVEALEQNHYFIDSITDGSNKTYTIPSLPAGYQMKIMLYWPDAPAIPLSASSLVNNLDLTVTDPGGVTHLPMKLDPSPGGVNNNAVEGVDSLNNIEQVLVNNPSAGNYTIKVKGTTIPVGPQKFYIAYEFIEPSVTMEYPYGGETWVPGSSETIRWSAYGGDPNGFTLEYSLNGGSTWNLISGSIPSTARYYFWPVPSVISNSALIRVTRNTTGYIDQSKFPFTLLGQPNLTVSNTCSGYAQLKWNSITGADHYEIMKLTYDTMQVIGITTDTSFLATPLKKDSSYWFSVRAINSGMAGRRAVAINITPNSGACNAGILDNDLTVDSVLIPQTGRANSSTSLGIKPISIDVRNPGNIAISSPIDFSYQVDGGPITSQTLPVSIPAHGNYVFTFSANYDFSAIGRYNLKAWIHFSLDTIPKNDTISIQIKNLRNDALILSPAFTEGFETAIDKTYQTNTIGLDSLDRTDFSNSNSNGRLNTFFNTGFARTGLRSMILDVNSSGTTAADSLINTFNLSNYSTADQIWLDLYFKKMSPVTPMPGNAVWVRGNDQAAWIKVKDLNDPLDAAGKYIKLNVDLSGILGSAIPAQTLSSSFQVKCGAEGKIPAASANPQALPGGGICFDDFTFTDAQHDAGMVGLLNPQTRNICALTNKENVLVLVRNYGTDTLYNVPVTYAVNQDTVTETIPALLPKDSLIYLFNQTVDMSGYQKYDIRTWISNPTDNYHNNDTSADYSIQTSPLINQYPYLEGFENNNGYWFTGGQNDSWQWGRPAKTVIHKAANGKNAWVTSLTGNYNDNEYSFLYSPCFDLSNLAKPVLSFSHIFQTEDNCTCDFHWVEYTLDDSLWTVLGNASSGVNWYDDAALSTWQKSDTIWHVSSYDIPVKPTKIRFRIVMYSDPGTNFEGVGIDDIHVFDKAPVFAETILDSMIQSASGSNWLDFEKDGKKIFSVNPNGNDLGNTKLYLYRDTTKIRDTAGQYYGGRNWVFRVANPPTSAVGVRFYFTDSEANQLIKATGCVSCLNIEDAYSSGVTQYSGNKYIEEDSTLTNNRNGNYFFHQPGRDVSIIPYDNGYYAETTVTGFSEFWLNGGGKAQDHPLAAWLKDFTAILSNNNGLLNWTSWQETGSLKYLIERSADSLNFSVIGSLPAYPHQDSIRGYQFTDTALLLGPNYYRIVIYLQNGDSLISPIRKLTSDAVQGDYKVYPIPTSGDIYINTSSNCQEIQIFDVTGRKVLERVCQGNLQHVSISQFPSGVYLLKVFTDKGNKLVKLEKR